MNSLALNNANTLTNKLHATDTRLYSRLLLLYYYRGCIIIDELVYMIIQFLIRDMLRYRVEQKS